MQVMASKEEIQHTYDWMDPFFRASLGETADITCAYYNGDFSLTLEQAQAAKHAYILDGVGFQPGMRGLDIGSGWGPLLAAMRDRGGRGVGITLSPAQAAACGRNGLEAYVKDWKELNPEEVGIFDTVISVGAFEHFCSVEDYVAGQQEAVYGRYFDVVNRLLPTGGRTYLQTMVWARRPRYEDISLDAPKGSNERLVALLGQFYPGSWAPESKAQITEIAKAHGFQLLKAESGRKDYLQTMKVWGERTRWYKPTMLPQVIWHMPSLLRRYMTDQSFRYTIESLRNGANQAAFEREILDHYRIFFEKIG
jgi:cyclopropane-fatty-acyl-phospholipid synthase